MKTSKLKISLILFGFTFFFWGCGNVSGGSIEFTGKTFNIESADGIAVTADLYEVKESKKPIILLFHQALFSRGEYRETAPKLNKLGYTCIAIDQRSGLKSNGIKNETAQKAKKEGLETEYINAITDLKAAIEYTISEYKNQKLILVGSSYSASLVLILEKEYRNSIAGIACFSPGEYYKYQEKEIIDFAKEIESPIFITSAGYEHDSWKQIFESIPAKNKESFIPDFKGKHGSKALWSSSKGNEVYWKEFTAFLDKVN